MSTWRSLSLSLVAWMAATGCGNEETGDLAARPECDLVAASGVSSGPSSAQELLDALEPGQTGCLREGTYDADDEIHISTPDITLTSYPGERATIVGRVVIEGDAERTRLEGLNLDGHNPDGLPSPTVNASGAVLADNEISNGHTAICVNVNQYEGSAIPEDVVIEGNRIHDCGRLPPTNHDHGIYLGESRGTVIRDNWIYGNADRGIQLYPDADGTTITGNVIDGNGQGIIFGSDDDDSPDHNLIQGNVITNSTIRYNVESHSQGAPYGEGNLVRRNCIHGGARDDGDGAIAAQEGFVAEENLVAEPGYLNRGAGDYRLPEDSPCAAILDDASTPAEAAVGG